MKLLRFALCTLLFVAATAVQSAELDPRYKSMGQIMLTFDGSTYEFVVPWDTKSNRPYAKEKEIAGQRYFTLSGSTVTETGKPGRTRFSVSFMLLYGMQKITDISLSTVQEGKRSRYSLFGESSSARFENFELSEDGAIKTQIEATLAQMNTEIKTGTEALEGAPPLLVQGEITVSLSEPD